MLDPQGTSVNAFSGELVFPGDMLAFDSISTVDSVVPLWLVRPTLSLQENFFSVKANIVFEGALPGGFEGIRSPYNNLRGPGKLFSVTFRPIKKGEALLYFNHVTVLKNDGNGTPDTVVTSTASLTIADMSTISSVVRPVPTKKQIANSTVEAYIAHDETIDKHAWILFVNDSATQKTIDSYEVAEHKIYDPSAIRTYEWKEITSPYVLEEQQRNYFVHVKVLYTDGTYSIVTLPPVENNDDEVQLWRILVVLGLIIFILYLLQKKKTSHVH
jgi:hypothetical protein